MVFAMAGCSADTESKFMRKASEELIDVLWNVDYTNFTPEKTTAYAKKYYESEFLKDYQSDILYNAGVNSIKEEKLTSKVLSIEDKGASTEDLGDTTYKKYTMKARIEIVSYKPVYPDDSVLEEGKTYDLIFHLYFAEENGKLKLCAFGYEPENGALLPKKANNVTLSAEQKNMLKQLSREYANVRYNFNYENYDPKPVYAFYEKNAMKSFMDQNQISMNYLNEFLKNIKTYKIKTIVTGLTILAIGENKTPIDLPQGMAYYYLAAIELKYKLSASKEYFEETQIIEGQEYTVREVLGFDFENGKPKIVFSEYE